MADRKATIARIESARNLGYNLMMVAVLSPLQVAINQAMNRAKMSRRFPHKRALRESHVAFRQHFMDYVPLFDAIHVYTNSGSDVSVRKVAEKKVEKELEISDSGLFNSALGLE